MTVPRSLASGRRTATDPSHSTLAGDLQDKPGARRQGPLDEAIALQKAGDRRKAEGAYRALIAAEPENHEAFGRLGILLLDDGRVPEAETLLRRALELAPDSPTGHFHLGRALSRQHRLGEAITAYEAAVACDPGFAGAVNNLAAIAKDQGRFHEGIALFRHALEIAPNAAWIDSNLVYSLHYGNALSREDMFEAHRAWARRHTAAWDELAPEHANNRDPDRRLRVGYLSPDFHFHPVSYLIGGVLHAHDRREIEIFCYSADRKVDDLTRNLKALADHWREVVGLNDEALVAAIRADAIDIVVDLAGHTARNRLPALARRPAPVQMTYLGYPDTTGLPAMGYRITDAQADPPGESDRLATERLVRVPGGFIAYTSPADAPSVSALPAAQSGTITFGSFNNLAKLSDETVSLWARVLRAVPGSRLLLKAVALGDSGTAAYTVGRFAARGIDADRLTMVGWTSQRVDHLAAYNGVDIALDPTPYNGTTTTCEALWMGAPVVSLEGDRHAARVGVSILTAAKLPNLIARDEAHYVRIAASLAQKRDELATMRSRLRHHLARTPLLSAKRLAGELEAVYREAWRNWCADAPKSS